eukprot:9469760-Pyramimonas_sp.AAC.1
MLLGWQAGVREQTSKQAEQLAVALQFVEQSDVIKNRRHTTDLKEYLEQQQQQQQQLFVAEPSVSWDGDSANNSTTQRRHTFAGLTAAEMAMEGTDDDEEEPATIEELASQIAALEAVLETVIETQSPSNPSSADLEERLVRAEHTLAEHARQLEAREGAGASWRGPILGDDVASTKAEMSQAVADMKIAWSLSKQERKLSLIHI